MPFGLTQLFEKTPKKMVVLGHSMLVAGAMAQEYDLSSIFPHLSNIVTVSAIAGAFLTTLFGENKKNNSFLKK